MLTTIIAFIVLLVLLVVVHELGHFWAARRFGVRVEEFGIGFPPAAKRWQRAQTTYSLNWLPLGGFVRLKGESPEAAGSLDADSFLAQTWPRRLAILLSGVVMNLVLAFLLLTVSFAWGAPRLLEGDLPSGVKVLSRQLRVTEVVPNAPAQEAGFQAGDEVRSVDGRPMATSAELRAYLRDQGFGPVSLNYIRDGQRFTAELTPRDFSGGDQPGLGLGLLATGIVRYPWYRAAPEAARETALLTGQLGRALGHLAAQLVRGAPVPAELSGPVGVAVLTGQVARLGLSYLLQFAAVLSVNLAVLNALPIPALDGGRALFTLIEGVRRRPVSQRLESALHRFGFALLLAAIALITYRDLVRYAPSWWQGIRSLL